LNWISTAHYIGCKPGLSPPIRFAPFFLQRDTLQVPFIKRSKKGALTPEQAEEKFNAWLEEKEVKIRTKVKEQELLKKPLSALPRLSEKQFYFHEIAGYTVVDQVQGEIGKVEKVLDYPMQALLQVMKGTKEILIPVADEIILKVDRKNRLLHIHAPEGLIEMYLE
jgi:ribosomal 30S subunit maturation factor RimM